VRRLTEDEIHKLVSRPQVRKTPVEIFLATMGEDAGIARQKLRLAAKLHGWMPATIKAILDGIALAETEEQKQVSSHPARRDPCPRCGSNLKRRNGRKGSGRWGVIYECLNPACEVIEIRRYYNKGGKTLLKTAIIKSAAAD